MLALRARRLLIASQLNVGVRHMHMHPPRNDIPSAQVLVTLTLFWLALLSWTLVLAADLWPAAGSDSPVGAVLRDAGARVAVLMVAAASAPLFLFTSLALRPADRRTLPAVLAVWAVVAVAAFIPGRPPTDVMPVGLVCASALVSAEMVRTVITALIRHGTRPVESDARSV